MKTIVVTTHKGGVGKTMLAAHIAWHFAEKGRRVLAIDLDTQGNLSEALAGNGLGVEAGALFASEALDALQAPAPGTLGLIGADKSLTTLSKAGMGIVAPFAMHLRLLAGQFDICIVDTNAEMNYLNIAALSAATHAITPTDMSSFGRQGVFTILQVIAKIQQTQNPGLRFLGVVPNRFAAGKTADVQNLGVLVETFGPGVVFPAVLRDGNAYKEAMEPVRGEDASGARPVWKDRKPAAQSHIADMARLLQLLECELVGQTLSEDVA